MRQLKPKDAFNMIINRANVAPMHGKTHAEYIERFEYTVCRDALHLHGSDFEDAEWMASHETGNARVRFGKCIRKLRL